MKIFIEFSLEILEQVRKGPPFVSHNPRAEGSESNCIRDISQRKYTLLTLKYVEYSIKNEFNFGKIIIEFSLEILKQVDKGQPFVSTNPRAEGSESNFIRDISTKVYSFNSL